MINVVQSLEIMDTVKIEKHLQSFRVKELKEVAKQIGLKVSGKKEVIIQTITAYYKNKQLAKDVLSRRRENESNYRV